MLRKCKRCGFSDNRRQFPASHPESMRVSYPLSLKVSLWLVLNLLLLAGLGVGFFVLHHGGLAWSALVAGPAGEQGQVLFNLIAGETGAAPAEGRPAVLQRFGEAAGAEFFLFGGDERLLAGNALTLPAAVHARMEFRGPGWAPPGGPGPGFAPKGGPPRKGDIDPDAARRRENGPDSAEKRARDRARFPGEPGTAAGRVIHRFVTRTEAPAAYWVAMRVAYSPSDRGNRPVPAMLVARVGSLWGVLSLLGHQAWLLAGGGVLALSVLFWLPLVRSITRSIGQLTRATEQIAEGRFETRVSTGRSDELGQLGDSVNRMAARLDAHIHGQRRFLGDVAHELCSPLARLQLASGILAEQAPPPLQATVGDLRDEVQQMSTLVNELLAFTKSGLQARHVVLGSHDLEPLVRDALAREGAGDRVTVTLAAGLRVTAEPDLLRRAIANLVRNALRYAGTAGPVTLHGERQGERVILSIEDEGPGVPPADLDRLGEPFFRPELARSREGGGVGLGLAIVRDSIAACQGEVRFSNRTPQGFRAELRLGAA